MSQASPFSVVRELSAGTVAQLFGSLSGSGLFIDNGAYRTGLKFFRACTETGFTVTPTQMSPFLMIWSCIRPQPRLRSNRLDGFNGSTMTVPLNLFTFAGRR